MKLDIRELFNAVESYQLSLTLNNFTAPLMFSKPIPITDGKPPISAHATL